MYVRPLVPFTNTLQHYRGKVWISAGGKGGVGVLFLLSKGAQNRISYFLTVKNCSKGSCCSVWCWVRACWPRRRWRWACGCSPISRRACPPAPGSSPTTSASLGSSPAWRRWASALSATAAWPASETQAREQSVHLQFLSDLRVFFLMVLEAAFA